MTEWRPVPGYPHYQVSNDGQVRTTHRCPEGRLLRQNWTGRDEKSRRYRVRLYANGVGQDINVHTLVARVFIGPMPATASLIRHLNDDPRDNRAVNLAYGTQVENQLDAIRNGHHPGVLKTACKRGHPLDETNTYFDRNGRRSCKTCRLAAQRAYYARHHPMQGQAHCPSCGRFITPGTSDEHTATTHGTNRPDGSIR